MSTYAITGIQEGLGPGDQVPLRREIDEWWFSADKNDEKQRSLFILALQQFMDMEPPDPVKRQDQDTLNLSYFSIAGIHGQPLVPWGMTSNDYFYCAHSQITFPTWHRPYLLLYEQRIYEEMCKLIPTTFDVEHHDTMFHAANTWRLPFWDWAVNKPDWDPDDFGSPKHRMAGRAPNVPFLLTQKEVLVRTSRGEKVVPNPMWRYVLPDQDKNFGYYGITNLVDKKGKEKNYSSCKATNRHPSSGNEQDPHWIYGDELNWQRITGALRGHDELANALPESVNRLFSYESEYHQFAKDECTKDHPPQSFANLETVHNKVHNYIGGNGHMSELPVAAFDPLFWLHHCNIDRLFAMWQELYKDKYEEWLEKDPAAKDHLAPFCKDSRGTMYTSESCSFHQRDLGYTYPELQGWLDDYKTCGNFDEEKYHASLRADVELKYASTGNSVLRLYEDNMLAEGQMSAMDSNYLVLDSSTYAFLQGTTLGPQLSFDASPSWEANDYILNVVYSRFALAGHPYSIRFFLGDVPAAGPPFHFEEWPTQIGSVYNFSSPDAGRGIDAKGCKNCKLQRETGHLSCGQVVLTDYLVDDIRKRRQQRGIILNSLSPEKVVEYLRRNLHWRIVDQHNRLIPKEEVHDLQVSVAMSRAVHYAEPSRFSEYGEYEVLWEVTSGRLAGATPEYSIDQDETAQSNEEGSVFRSGTSSNQDNTYGNRVMMREYLLCKL